MVVARCAAAFCLLIVAVAGCVRYACPGACPENQPAIFDLSCGPTDLASVALSGPCSLGDASPSNYLFESASTSLAVRSPNPGECKVILTFATGFTYSANVTFTSQNATEPPGCHGCSPYTAPTQDTFTVNNPTVTCVHSWLDAAGDAPTDAAAGALGDAGDG